MPPQMIWLTSVVQIAIVPVLLGALSIWHAPQRSDSDMLTAAGLVLLGAIHVLYWSRPWPAKQRRAVAAAAVMVLTNVVLLDVLNLSLPLFLPLLWIYPALVVGSGLRPQVAIAGIGLLAVAAVAPTAHLEITGALGEIEGMGLVRMLGSDHAILLAVVLAGLGMAAVRQLIALNVDLYATRAELADLAVTADRDRLARELHDLLGRTLSLIAVKAELASRLSAKGDPSADAELADVQRLARQAVRDVREAIAGDHAPSVDAELAAAEAALRTAGIEGSVDNTAASIDPAHETTIAWALREAVTNVVKHSGARTCRISLHAADGATTLEVIDDGRGPIGGGTGTGLEGLADRIRALGGTIEVGPGGGRGFRPRVRLAAATPPRTPAGVAR